ncbi:hypothetical protein PC123_g14452 [Phytophthora cactorum]|nr:hypothetical protein PC120_g6876 [Phytophthora cactorum]KAG4050302.1 hypothetical protein PC123_g14452 [Phytophthora cactorum]
MAIWLSFFAEYDFRVEYKPGRLNVVADALSRRPSMFGMVASSLSGGGSTVAFEQPQKSADTDTVSAVKTRRQAASRSGNETADKNYGSGQGTDTATTNNTSVQGTDGAQAGPVAGKKAVLNKPFSTQAMDFVQADKL